MQTDGRLWNVNSSPTRVSLINFFYKTLIERDLTDLH